MTQTTPQRLSRFQTITWILSLAAVAVGLRNFEQGLTNDAPLYATLARNIVTSGEWFLLDSGISDYRPYAEHTHLGYWVLALVLKVFASADWAVRLPGCFFYVGLISMLFYWGRKYFSESVAVWTLLLLLIFPKFSNFFSNVYLDPGCLFFGLGSVFLLQLSLEKKRSSVAALAGFFLGLSFMYKGLMALGFCPAWGFLLLNSLWKASKSSKKTVITKILFPSFLILGLTVGGYALAVFQSNMPRFFEIYWHNQMNKRFIPHWIWERVYDWRGWPMLLRDTHYMLILIPLCLLTSRKKKQMRLPVVLLTTFIALACYGDLAGNQYWMPILPWIALLLSSALFSKINIAPIPLVKWSTLILMLIVFLVQFFPWNMHRLAPPEEIKTIEVLRLKAIPLFLLVSEQNMHPVVTSRYSWYANISVRNVLTDTKEKYQPGFLYFISDQIDQGFFAANNLCLHATFTQSSLWYLCQVR